jgi:hypothetical protein
MSLRFSAARVSLFLAVLASAIDIRGEALRDVTNNPEEVALWN